MINVKKILKDKVVLRKILKRQPRATLKIKSYKPQPYRSVYFK